MQPHITLLATLEIVFTSQGLVSHITLCAKLRKPIDINEELKHCSIKAMDTKTTLWC